jgi:hypothetical protein
MMDFLKNFFIQKAGDVQSGFVKMIVEFDPETASEAEIATLDDALTKLTQQMVGAKRAWDREQKEALEIKKGYELRVAAAERLQAQADAAADPAQKARIEESLTKLLGELEKMVPEVEREEPFLLQPLGDVPGDEPAGQPLHDGGLPDSGLPDQDRLRPASTSGPPPRPELRPARRHSGPGGADSGPSARWPSAPRRSGWPGCRRRGRGGRG